MVPVAQSLTVRSSGVRLEDLIAVPIDVGKHSAMAKVIDFTGTTLAKPFTFELDRCGSPPSSAGFAWLPHPRFL